MTYEQNKLGFVSPAIDEYLLIIRKLIKLRKFLVIPNLSLFEGNWGIFLIIYKGTKFLSH